MELTELKAEIERQRRALEQLESQLESAGGPQRKSWYRSGFYTSYYVISGLMLGALAAWVSLAFNVVGAWIAYGDPFRLLRIYATFFGGEAVLASDHLTGIAILLALILHSATGAVVGAPIHVIYSRFVSESSILKRLIVGMTLGIVMWLVNFYAILSWLQPVVSGGQYIIEQIPLWVAALTHIAFALTMLILQPYWTFDPSRIQDQSEYRHSVAASTQ